MSKKAHQEFAKGGIIDISVIDGSVDIFAGTMSPHPYSKAVTVLRSVQNPTTISEDVVMIVSRSQDTDYLDAIERYLMDKRK